jgi:hypothetical protein
MAPFRRGRPFGTGGEFAGGEFREPVQVPVACTRTGDDLGDIIGMFGLVHSMMAFAAHLFRPPADPAGATMDAPMALAACLGSVDSGKFGGCLSRAEAEDNGPVDIVGVTTDVPVVVGVYLIDH